VKDRATPFAVFWSEFGENRVAVAALGIVVLVVLLAVFAPLVAPQDPYDLAKLTLRDARRAPGLPALYYVAGHRRQGRDMLSAILYGLDQLRGRDRRSARSARATMGSAAFFGGNRRLSCASSTSSFRSRRSSSR
jgi:peptide/nickel transport system permease protein